VGVGGEGDGEWWFGSISGAVVVGLAVLIAVDGKPQEKKSKNWAPKGSPRKWGAMSVVCWE
jgi:hypothetical protein